jgi:ATP-dependent helicase HepA
MYFDRPGDGGTITRTVPGRCLKRAVLSAQTRVHFRDGSGHWQHGRVLFHDIDTQLVETRLPRGVDILLREADVHVRWRRRLSDATHLLADAWVESRRFFDARSAFVAAYLARTSAYQGLTALSSSAIEMHPHQLEAMRRVLTDVSPRYLLADEVGLGKTIEAALLIRQHLADAPDTRVLAIVPRPLVQQWEDELAAKFRIQRQFPDRCTITSVDAFAQRRPDPSVTMAVVDEAHRLTASGASGAIYEQLRRLAHDVDVLILLSATPLLQEPASLLRLLHLLAPEAHPLDDVAAFERALAARDEIGAYVANLTTDVKPVFLRSALTGLADTLSEDAQLVSLLRDVEVAPPSTPATSRRSSARSARREPT